MSWIVDHKEPQDLRGSFLIIDGLVFWSLKLLIIKNLTPETISVSGVFVFHAPFTGG